MGKKIVACVLAMALFLALSGCNMVFVDEEKDKLQVVAQVGDKEILKQEVLEIYESSLATYGYTEQDLISSQGQSAVDQLKQSALDTLVENALVEIKAKEMGVDTLTEEQEENIDSELESLKGFVENFVDSQIEALAEEDPTLDKEAKKEELLNQQLEEYGFNDGTLKESYVDTAIKQNIQTVLVEGYTPTAEEMQAWYDENVEIQKEQVESSPGMVDTFENAGVAFYYPAGMRYVKNLLIAIPDDKKEEIDALRSEDKDDEADELRDLELAKIQPTAQKAYEAALEDFDAALEQYGQDEGMTQEPAKSQGYRIYSSMTGYDTNFVSAGMALTNVGDVSEPVASDFGYFIIQYASEIPEGPVEVDLTDQFYIDERIDAEKEDRYEAELEKWKEELVTTYPDRLA